VGLIPQLIAIAILTAIGYAAFPNLGVPFDIFIAALVYLVFCRIMRAKFVRDHRSGMKMYHAQKFQEAISHFEASYRFFSAHRHLDTWRSLLFGVASPNPYRVIALCNMAYCYSQVGDGQQAIKLYQQALQEEPCCALAKASLNMLHSVSARGTRILKWCARRELNPQPLAPEAKG
jgi:tetratricopeptide (TPR) repeat protein